MSFKAPALDKNALFYMFLLALQFGMQPTLTRKFTPQGICRSTVVLMQEVLKFILAYTMLTLSGSKSSALSGGYYYLVLLKFFSFLISYRFFLRSLQDGTSLLGLRSHFSQPVSMLCRIWQRYKHTKTWMLLRLMF